MDRFKEFKSKYTFDMDNQNYKRFSYTKVHVFQYYSDLHIEHQPYGTVPTIIPIPDEKVDYEPEDNLPIFFVKNLILAGDIGDPLTDEYWEFLKTVNDTFDNVFLICGNHEYYNTSIDYVNRLIQANISFYELKNVHFLNNSSFMLDSSIKVVGSTMWSFIPEDNKKDVENYLNDYRLIQDFNTDKCNQLHKEAVNYIENELSKSKKNVVITHHAPTFENSSNPIYKNQPTTCAFASSLEHLVDKASFWVYGHTHFNGGNNKKLKSNQLGYNWSRPARGFHPEKHFVMHSFTQY
jgi:predicted phosphohydrolase